MDMLGFVTPEGIVAAWRVVRLVVVVLWVVWRVAAEALRDGRGSDVARAVVLGRGAWLYRTDTQRNALA